MRILIVEGRSRFSPHIMADLQDHGIDPEIACSIEQAVSRLIRAEYDAYLVDLFPTDGSAIALTNFIRARHPDKPIVMVTGSTVFQRGDHGRVIGADYLLRKPVQGNDLANILKYLTGRLTAAENMDRAPARDLGDGRSSKSVG